MPFVSICIGWPSSHFTYLLFYAPERLASPLSLLQVTAGMSSVGFLSTIGGAAVVFALLTRDKVWHVLDGMAAGLAVGWTLGRLGCFVVHDHPGTETTFPLGVQGICYGDWGLVAGSATTACHDLGLYEMLASMVFTLLAALLIAIRRVGWSAIALPMLYAPLRFGLDFLRPIETEIRWGGLTVAQWSCFILVGIAIIAAIARVVLPPLDPESTDS